MYQQTSVQIFNEDQSCMTVSVGVNMSAVECCHKLVLLNTFKEDPNWVIAEHVTDLGIGKSILFSSLDSLAFIAGVPRWFLLRQWGDWGGNEDAGYALLGRRSCYRGSQGRVFIDWVTALRHFFLNITKSVVFIENKQKN